MNNIPALLWNSNYEKVKYWLGNSSGSTRVIVGVVHRKVQMCFLRDGMSMRNCENRKGRLKRQVGTRDTGPICGVEAEADMTVTSLPLGAMDFPDHQKAPCTQTRALSCVCVCVCVCVCLFVRIVYGLMIIWNETTGFSPSSLGYHEDKWHEVACTSENSFLSYGRRVKAGLVRPVTLTSYKKILSRQSISFIYSISKWLLQVYYVPGHLTKALEYLTKSNETKIHIW